MLDIIINYHKRKLEKMIMNKIEYEKIVKQSQKLDKYISKKMKEINLKKQVKKVT